MARLWVPSTPRGLQSKAASAIRAPAEAGRLALHAQERTNWLLAQGASQVFEGWFPSTVNDITSRIYHRRSVNADRLLVIAIIQQAIKSTGTFTFTPSGGTAVTETFDDDSSTTPWGDPSWQCKYFCPTLVDTGLQYHTVEWTDLYVRGLLVLELARDALDSSVDTMLADMDGSYSGLITRRYITEGSTGGLCGIPDVLSAIASARDATKRHGGGIIIAHADAWSTNSSTPDYENVADVALGTSGFGFKHQARRVRDATASVGLECRIEARYTGTGSASFQLRSEKTSDTVTFSSITSSWAWHAPDSSATLDVASTAADTIYPEGWVDGATTVEVASIQYLE